MCEFEDAAKLSTVLGYWPDFADAQLVEVRLSRASDTRSAQAKFKLDYIDTDQGKQIICLLSFEGVRDVNLQDYKDQNVVDVLSITKTDDGYEVNLTSVVGLNGDFCCNSVGVDVFNAQPWPAASDT